MAGGLGKTVVAARDVKDFLHTHHQRVLVLCHDTEILAQNRQKFQSIIGDQYTYGDFHGLRKDFKEVDILFATFQTMGGMRNWKEAFFQDEFAYLIVDESHHSRARTYEKVLGYFQPNFRLGLTATPDREDGKSLETIFGKAIFTLDFVDAWTYGFLTPVDYQLVTKEMDLSSLSSSDWYLPPKALDQKIFTRMSDQELVKDMQERVASLGSPRVVVFCQSIPQADKISRLYPGSRPLHSDLPRAQRERNLQDFRNGSLQTLVVRDMLNEGVDVPEVDVIMRLRLTDSKTLFEQQLARGLRLCEGKKNVRVYDYVGSVEQLVRLFDYEDRIKRAQRRLLSEQSQRERQAGKRTQQGGPAEQGSHRSTREQQSDDAPWPPSITAGDIKSRKFVVNFTGGDLSITKVDIKRIIARSKSVAQKYTNGCNPDTLLQSLVSLVRELGYMPLQNEIIVDSRFAAIATYLKYLGPTWQDVINKAKAALGQDADNIEWRFVKHTPLAYATSLPVAEKQAIVVRFIQDFVKQTGRLPTMDELCAMEGSPSRAAFGKGRVFPDFTAAIVMAGYDPTDPTLRKARPTSTKPSPMTPAEAKQLRQQQLLQKIAVEVKARGCPLLWHEIDKCPRLPRPDHLRETLGVTDWETEFVPLLRKFMAGDDAGVYWRREDLWRAKQKEVFLEVMLELRHVPSRREMGGRFGSQDGITRLREYGTFNDFVEYMRPEILALAEAGKIKKEHVGRRGWFEFLLGRDATKQDVIEAAQRKARQQGGALVQEDLTSDPDMPSPYIIKKFYAHFSDLLADAEIEISARQQSAIAGHRHRKTTK